MAATATTVTRNLAHVTLRADGIHPDCTAGGALAKIRETGLKIRSRKFDGRCARHKRYNPAVDGLGGIRGGCRRCQLLFEIWQTSLALNQLIRQFDPNHDDVQQEHPAPPLVDPRQMTLLEQ